MTDQMAVYLHRRDLYCNQQQWLALLVTLGVMWVQFRQLQGP